MKSTILWDITPYSPLRVNRRFGGTLPPSSWSKNKPSNHLLSLWFLGLFFDPEDGGYMYLENVG
jgi:hypothetical protein